MGSYKTRLKTGVSKDEPVKDTTSVQLQKPRRNTLQESRPVLWGSDKVTEDEERPRDQPQAREGD